MVEEVKRFYKNLSGYSKDREISIRLHGAVARAMRSSYYELKDEYKPEIFKKHLLAAFVEVRIFDRVKGVRIRECFSVVDRITEDLWSILENKSEEEKWKFFESFVKLYEVKRNKIEI